MNDGGVWFLFKKEKEKLFACVSIFFGIKGESNAKQ